MKAFGKPFSFVRR